MGIQRWYKYDSFSSPGEETHLIYAKINNNKVTDYEMFVSRVIGQLFEEGFEKKGSGQIFQAGKATAVEIYVKMLTGGLDKWCRQFKQEAYVSLSWKDDLCQTVECFECPTKERRACCLRT